MNCFGNLFNQLRDKSWIFGLVITFSSIHLSFTSQNEDIYVTTADLNLRSGPGTSYESVVVLKKGDTVELLSTPAQYWVKLKYKNYEGFSARQYLQRLPYIQETPPLKKEPNNFAALIICTIAGWLVIILLRKANNGKAPSLSSGSNQPKHHSTITVIPKIKVSIGSDTSIIDVNQELLDLNIDYQGDSKVPYWSHTYVYSFEDIGRASKAQKEFYEHLKRQVLKGELVDIEDNSNYAFVLYFDLLNEYQTHRDLELLEYQFKLIGKICPRTLSYSLLSLKNELEKLDTKESKEKLEQLDDPTYLYERGYSDYNPDMYKLGNIYQKKLQLKPTEVKWLNKFYYPSNTFNSIEGCCIAIIKCYLSVLDKLNKHTPIDNGLKRLFEKIIDIEQLRFSDFTEANTLYERKWAFNKFQECFFLTIFKKVENKVREHHGNKRMLTIAEYYPYSKETVLEIERTFGEELPTYIESVVVDIPLPNLDTQKELNALNVNRWIVEFEAAKGIFKEKDVDSFLNALNRLEISNQKNPKIEAIFFEASQFLSKHNHVAALRIYGKYIHYNALSNYKKKELPHHLKEKISNNEGKLNHYETILNEIASSKNLHGALEKIDDLFILKRKRISLNRSEIDNVRKKHDGTVGLLNKYLETEDETPEKEEVGNMAQQQIHIHEQKQSLFKTEIGLTSIQENLIKGIAENSFSILQAEVESYAANNSLFKNQLIDSINEACEAYLDGEPLIEEVDESYIIEESYYKEILE